MAMLVWTGGALLGCDDRGPTAPESSTESSIAFVSDRDGNAEIYVMRADGTDVRRLTRHAASDESPAWSPDRRRLAFVSDRDGNAELYVMDREGAGLRRLTVDAAADGSPAWSPDGRRIAFVSDREGEAQVFVLDVDGPGSGAGGAAAVTRVTPDGGPNVDPAWSPDGTRLAYVAMRDGAGTVFVANADGTGHAPLGAGGDGTAPERTPSWSPDGRSIAFAASVAEEPTAPRYPQIFVSAVDGTGRRQLTHASDGTGPSATEPAWSPDGRRIVFVRRRSTTQPELYGMSADGADAVPLSGSTAHAFGSAAWSPDGARIAMLDGPALYVLTWRGARLRRVHEGVAPADDYGLPAWSPDGTRLALVDRGDAPGLLLVNVDGGAARTVPLAGVVPWSVPVWAPDGGRLAIAAQATGDRSPRVYAVDADGGGLAPIRDADGDRWYEPTDWSPDGATLLVAGSKTPPEFAQQVFALQLATGSLTPLTTSARPSAGSWGARYAPDGRRIAFIGDAGGRSNEVFVMNADGTGRTRLTAGTGQRIHTVVRWSPAGDRIAAAYTGTEPIFPPGVAVVAAGGGTETDPGMGLCSEAEGPSWNASGSELVFSCSQVVAYRPTHGVPYTYRRSDLYVARIADGTRRRLTHGAPPFDAEPAW